LLELKPETVQFFIEQSLSIDVRGNDPALVAAVIESGKSVRVQDAPCRCPGREPGEIIRIQDQQPLAADLWQQIRNPALFDLQVAPAIRCCIHTREIGFVSSEHPGFRSRIHHGSLSTGVQARVWPCLSKGSFQGKTKRFRPTMFYGNLL